MLKYAIELGDSCETKPQYGFVFCVFYVFRGGMQRGNIHKLQHVDKLAACRARL